jgi:hypothetical protein
LKSLTYFAPHIAASWDARRLARRLAYRVMIRPTGAAAPERFSALRRCISMNLLGNSRRCAVIPGFFPVCTSVVTPAHNGVAGQLDRLPTLSSCSSTSTRSRGWRLPSQSMGLAEFRPKPSMYWRDWLFSKKHHASSHACSPIAIDSRHVAGRVDRRPYAEVGNTF